MALERKLPVTDVGMVYFALSDALHSTWLMDSVEKLPVEGRWHAQARGVLRDELQAQQRSLVGIVLASATPGTRSASRSRRMRLPSHRARISRSISSMRTTR